MLGPPYAETGNATHLNNVGKKNKLARHHDPREVMGHWVTLKKNNMK